MKHWVLSELSAEEIRETVKEIALFICDQQARIRELEATNAELVALVEQVEFIQDNGPRNRDYDVCPWCESWMRDGHNPDCPRQAALAKVRGEEAGR